MRLLILVSGLSLAFAVSACNDDSDLKNAQNQRHADLKKSLEWTRNARLIPADSCAHAEETLKASVRKDMELALAQQLQCALPSSDCYDHDGIIVDDMASPPGSPEAGGDSPEDFSDTNVQVQGVDEADIVKTDGEDIIGIFDQYVVAARAWPPENLRELAHIRIPGSPQGLYLEGDQIVVLSRLYGKPYSYGWPNEGWPNEGGAEPGVEEPSPPPADIGYEMYGWPVDGTLLTLIDRKDNTLTIRKQQFFEGAQIDSRRIDNHLYFALTHPRRTPNLSYAVDIDVYNASERAIRQAYDRLREKNLRAIDELTLDWWTPQSYDFHTDTGIDLDSHSALSDCTQLYTANNYSGAQNLVSIVTYNLEDGNLSASTIQGDWGTVYASPHAFYLASTNWQWNGWWGPADTQIPETITQIHKFAFEESGAAHYTASGAVEGYPLNQFAFDEYQNHLRVATTLGNFGWSNPNTSESHVHILSETHDALETVGRVEQLGVGESIYAVRFMGDKGYVVTFRQIDPLYVLDLSNPAAPFAAGELEIPGYSTYMHPIEDGHLLTIGRDADLNGRVGGLKLEIFNVQDPTAPRSVTTHVLGNDWGVDSEATYDHKAFMYFPARQLLAIPVAGWLETRPGTIEYQSALHVFHIEPTAIEPIGTIRHEALFQTEDTATECYNWRDLNDTNVRRGIFMDDILFSISNAGILSHDTRAINDGPISGLIANPRIASALEEARDRCGE